MNSFHLVKIHHHWRRILCSLEIHSLQGKVSHIVKYFIFLTIEYLQSWVQFTNYIKRNTEFLKIVIKTDQIQKKLKKILKTTCILYTIFFGQIVACVLSFHFFKLINSQPFVIKKLNVNVSYISARQWVLILQTFNKCK